MLLSPEAYIQQYANYSYEDLLVVRDELIDDIKAYENGNIHPKAYSAQPGPEDIYQRNLEYLVEISRLIQKSSQKQRQVKIKQTTVSSAEAKKDLDEGSVLYKIIQIKKLLAQHGFESEIKYDHRRMPYLNIGNEASMDDSIQFYCKENSGTIKCMIGRGMMPWSPVAYSALFRKNWINQDIELYLAFERLYELDDFIHIVAIFKAQIDYIVKENQNQ